MLLELIEKGKEGNDDAVITLINKFNPIIKKYTHMLFYEDAYNDLILDFIQLIHNIKFECINNKSDGALVLYISKSIYNDYIKRSNILKKNNKTIYFFDLSISERNHIELKESTTDNYFASEIDLTNNLTKKEETIIRLLYVKNYSVKEIASKLNITRQAVNQSKIRALKKLKKIYMDKLNNGEREYG